MRETCTSGSEGGGAQTNGLSLPLSRRGPLTRPLRGRPLPGGPGRGEGAATGGMRKGRAVGTCGDVAGAGGGESGGVGRERREKSGDASPRTGRADGLGVRGSRRGLGCRGRTGRPDDRPEGGVLHGPGEKPATTNPRDGPHAPAADSIVNAGRFLSHKVSGRGVTRSGGRKPGSRRGSWAAPWGATVSTGPIDRDGSEPSDRRLTLMRGSRVEAESG
jgi:hypothetical protein